MSEQNKAAARRLFEEVISQGDLDAVDELFTADYQDHDPANEEDTRGRDGVREEVGGYRAAFPDLTMNVEDQLADGDLVATRWSCRGTHRGELMGVPASGNGIQLSGITIHRFAGGQIAEGYWNWDTLGMMQQIGAIPAEQPA